LASLDRSRRSAGAISGLDRENPRVTEIPVISRQTVFDVIDPKTAIGCTREAFERYGRGEWEMPAKVYLDSPPYGDFRAMPALGDGLALLKWVTSFPGNSARGLPVVRGEVLLSDAETGEELAVIE
jgi:alanine dehydrogenase